MKVKDLELIIEELENLKKFANLQDYKISSRINKTVVQVNQVLKEELSKLKNEKIEVTGPKIKIITFTDSKEQNKDLVTLTNDILNELINDGYHIIDYNVMNIYDPERSYSFIKYTT